MWKRSHSRVFKSVNKEAIWRCWSDVNSWHEWVPNIEYCRLDKPFVTGNHFTLKPKGAPAVTVELLDVEKGQKFTGCTRFFGATLYDTHEMRNDTNGIRVTVTLKVTGPLGFLWRKLVAEKIEANLPKLMQNLISVSSSQEQQKAKAQPGSFSSKKVTPIISISPPKKSKSKLSSSASRKVTPISNISSTTKGKSMSSSSTSKKVTPISRISSTAKGITALSSSAVKKVKPKTAKTKASTSAVKKAKPKASTSATKKLKSKATISKPKTAKTKAISAVKKATKPKTTASKPKEAKTVKTKAKVSTSAAKKATKPKASASKPKKATPKKSASTAKKS